MNGPERGEMMELGILTLLPPVLIIITALITKKTTSSLLIGVLLCYSLKYGTDLLDPFTGSVPARTRYGSSFLLLFLGALFN